MIPEPLCDVLEATGYLGASGPAPGVSLEATEYLVNGRPTRARDRFSDKLRIQFVNKNPTPMTTRASETTRGDR